MPAKYSAVFIAQYWKALKKGKHAYEMDLLSDAATRGVLQKKVFLKILQISLENPSVGISF